MPASLACPCSLLLAVELVMSQTHVLNGNEIAIDRATPKEKTTLLPGRLRCGSCRLAAGMRGPWPSPPLQAPVSAAGRRAPTSSTQCMHPTWPALPWPSCHRSLLCRPLICAALACLPPWPASPTLQHEPAQPANGRRQQPRRLAVWVDARHELPCLAAQVSIIPSRAGRRLVTRRPRSSLLGGCVVQKGKRGRLHVLLAP